MDLDFEKPGTLEESHLVIEALWGFCRTLKQEVVFLRKENAELKGRLNLNSSNSSKPPCSGLRKEKEEKG